MESLSRLVSEASSFVWGVPMLVLLVGTGLFLTIRLRGLQFRALLHAFRLIFKSEEAAKGEISPEGQDLALKKLAAEHALRLKELEGEALREKISLERWEKQKKNREEAKAKEKEKEEARVEGTQPSHALKDYAGIQR